MMKTERTTSVGAKDKETIGTKTTRLYGEHKVSACLSLNIVVSP